ncbi:MAG: hypothetical protein FJW94_08790 [Actinobacteria bacterium]|nr:hypothetical protein [Actinomycetota bacterium]
MSTVPADAPLQPIDGEALTFADQTAMFHLVVVALDPYTHESSWILETAGRILTNFHGADCRVAWLVRAPAVDAEAFLGSWAERVLTFADPDGNAIEALGITAIPALVHVGTNLDIVGRADGWDPAEWKAVTDNLAGLMAWNRVPLPRPGDPVAFPGVPVSG